MPRLSTGVQMSGALPCSATASTEDFRLLSVPGFCVQSVSSLVSQHSHFTRAVRCHFLQATEGDQVDRRG